MGPGSPLFAGGRATGQPRLSYDELLQRRKEGSEKRRALRERASATGKSIAEGLSSLPVEDESGAAYKYVLDQKVSLPRQKSALLPVLHDAVQVTRVSIYNRPIHAKFPLLGLKFKNTTGQPLMQGPLAVFEAGLFAGDVRLPDLKPDEERLLSYALDLGMEVRTVDRPPATDLMRLAVRYGRVIHSYRHREVKTYLVRNHSREDRLLVVSHPIRAGWTVTGKEQPALRSRDLYRFEWKVPAGQAVSFDVVEERNSETWSWSHYMNEAAFRALIDDDVASEHLRAAVRKALAQKVVLSASAEDVNKVRDRARAIDEEQARLRLNIDKVPKGSAVHKRYVESFGELETALKAVRRDTHAKEERHRLLERAFNDYLDQLNVR